MASNLFLLEASECFRTGEVRVEETFQEKKSDKNVRFSILQRTCPPVKNALLDQAKQEERENIKYSVSATRNILPYSKKKFRSKFFSFLLSELASSSVPHGFPLSSFLSFHSLSLVCFSSSCFTSCSQSLPHSFSQRQIKLRTLIENSHTAS